MSTSSTPLNNASRPRRPSFIDLFLGTEPKITRSNRGMKMVVPKKTLKPVPSTEANVATTAAPTPEPATTPAPAAETLASPTPEPAKETIAAADPTSVTEANINSWTEMEDTVLIGMKAQGKSWKEIHEALPTKSKNDLKQLKQRFKELNIDTKGKGNDRVVSFTEATGQGKKDAKKGVLKAAGDDSDPTEDEGIDPRGPLMSDTKIFKKHKKTSTLKIVEVDSDEEELTDLSGHPIVYMDPDAGLSEAHLTILYKLTRKNDDVKWLEIASRFYDKTGKRMEPDVLKHMLRNL